jgi:predicted metal-binding membrane protein
MNMLWIAGLTALVLIEKAAPRGELVARVAGVVMVAGGGWMIAW